VLCTTSTLAQGVNLPAHLVILKGTRRWTHEKGEVPGNREYDRSTILQMIGRAGRPQFDDEGIAILMTPKEVCGSAHAKAQGRYLPFIDLEQKLHTARYDEAGMLADGASVQGRDIRA
jgi:replicative superfamily II helicase